MRQRLEYVVVASIDHQHVGIGVPERTCRREPREAAADNHNTLTFGSGPSTTAIVC